MGQINMFAIAGILLLTAGCDQGSQLQIKEADSSDPLTERSVISENNGKRKVGNLSERNYDLSYFSGEAEISTYTLDKARYNGVHPGEAVLIFVTEPFLVSEQVKNDNPGESESIQVLKMNRIERFSTGVYDYSMMTSVFTPGSTYDASYPLKVTFSSQDWCGQSFMQLNNDFGYEILVRSYFESESDYTEKLDYCLTEDNIFNMARMDTALLPRGEFLIYPAMSYIRLSHEEFKPYTAKASLARMKDQVVYVYEIPELKRSVRIFMDPNDRFKILKWEETYPTLMDGKLRTSTYFLACSKRMKYWEKNSARDAHLRDSLFLR
ncbi:MAG: septum formation inhibitor Maf [Brumimicrobium sp.]|nr:septum formation inhibitor Maf [Brumimicrobium sp.]